MLQILVINPDSTEYDLEEGEGVGMELGLYIGRERGQIAIRSKNRAAEDEVGNVFRFSAAQFASGDPV